MKLKITEVEHLRVRGAILRNENGLTLKSILDFQDREPAWFLQPEPNLPDSGKHQPEKESGVN